MSDSQMPMNDSRIQLNDSRVPMKDSLMLMNDSSMAIYRAPADLQGARLIKAGFNNILEVRI